MAIRDLSAMQARPRTKRTTRTPRSTPPGRISDKAVPDPGLNQIQRRRRRASDEDEEPCEELLELPRRGFSNGDRHLEGAVGLGLRPGDQRPPPSVWRTRARHVRRHRSDKSRRRADSAPASVSCSWSPPGPLPLDWTCRRMAQESVSWRLESRAAFVPGAE